MADSRPSAAPSPAGSHDLQASQRLQTWISATLIGGVVLSAVLIAAGIFGLLLGSAQPGEPASVAELIQQQSHTTSLEAIFAGVEFGRATSLIRLGVFVLILTPVARVALTFFLFLARHEWILAALTIVVLALLLLGITGTVG